MSVRKGWKADIAFRSGTTAYLARGSTAEKANLKVGDILSAIDGRSTLDIPLGQVRMMLGQQNAYVLTVRRGATTREVPVTLNASL